MMKIEKKFLSTGLLLLMTVSIWAQKGIEDGSKYGHGQDSIDCRMNASLFYEAAKQKSFADAVKPWTYCFENCPKATKNIYIQGVKIVAWQYTQAKTKEEKQEKLDLLMRVYDQRIQYFGNDPKYGEAYLLGEKASTLLKLKDDVASLKSIYEWFSKSINELGPNAKTSNLQEFMKVNYDLYNISEVNPEELINNYELTQSILEDQRKAASDPKEKEILSKILEANTNNIANTGILNCDSMEELFAAKVEANKEDVEYLTKSLNFFEKTGCDNNPSYYKASEYIYAIEPNAAAARAIAASYLKREDIESALKYYNEAISMEEDAEQKAKMHYTVAMINWTKKEDFAAARKYAQLAIKEDPKWGEPYMLIGNLYAQSAQKQMLGSKDIENMAGYWAAVDKYTEAKKVDPSVATNANNLIKLYSNYFPGKELIFFEPDYEEGKIVTVGGWIKEKTVVRAKD